MVFSLLKHSFLILFCFSYQVVQSRLNLQRNNGSEARPFCSRKCGKSDPRPANEAIPLYECSCSPSCSIYGDCCFDSPYKNTAQRSKDFICFSVVGHDRYRAVSGCPSNVSADFCKDGLGHQPPVTSKVTNITYANIFCAQCNDDKEDLITWNVELRCASEVSNPAVYFYQSGNIWSLNEDAESNALCKYHVHYNDSSFMEGLELRSCTAYIRKRSRCSSSYKDKAASKLCRSYEDPVYFHNTAYRNANCAMCNYLNPEFTDCIPDEVKNALNAGLVDSSVKNFCRSRGSSACMDTFSKGHPYPFADLLIIYDQACVPPPGRRCCVGEAFDSRIKRCKKIRN